MSSEVPVKRHKRPRSELLDKKEQLNLSDEQIQSCLAVDKASKELFFLYSKGVMQGELPKIRVIKFKAFLMIKKTRNISDQAFAQPYLHNPF
jgi:hypothetical protein